MKPYLAIISSCLLIAVVTGCSTARIIHGEFVSNATQSRSFAGRQADFVQTVESVATRGGFEIHERRRYASQSFAERNHILYLGSFVWTSYDFLAKGYVYIHVTADNTQSIPSVAVQGDGVFVDKVSKTTNDIIHDLRKRYSNVDFGVETIHSKEF